MNSAKPNIEELKADKSLKEIIEIVRLVKDADRTAIAVEDITRPIIPLRDDADEIKVVNYMAL
jgi:hypothetical protein